MKSNWIWGLFLAVFFVHCDDDTQEQLNDFFPPVHVNTNINLSFPQYSDLLNIQGFVYLPEGNKGIIVYHSISGEYVAFDRTCSYLPSQACSFVSVDSNRTRFRCGQYQPDFKPCCGSQFDANSGIVTVGPARIGLKQYFVNKQGNTIYISSTPI